MRHVAAKPHPCPGGCGIPDVPHHRLACPRCWARLPLKLRQLINATYALRHDQQARRDHWQALVDARRWYAENPPSAQRPATR